MRRVDFSLYLITDRHQTCGRPLGDVLRMALDGGVKAVQLREKDLDSAGLFRLATEMRLLTSDYGAGLFINDRVDVALAVGADGVQIGIGSIPADEVRRITGSRMLIGYSAHGIEEARGAQEDGADFVTFGPVYFTPSKAAFGSPCGISTVAETAKKLAIPVFALGGIGRENIEEIMSAGVGGIAVISAILAASDPRAATTSMLKTIEENAALP